MTPNSADPDDVALAVADLDTIVSLSKRRGFIYPSSEIYGGINAVWDYGPLGVELKNNVKRAWWRAMVQSATTSSGSTPASSCIPRCGWTSGHVGSFSDLLVECQTDHRRFRLDELPGAEGCPRRGAAGSGDRRAARSALPCGRGPLSAPRRFNLMFKTFMGPVEDEAAVIYLRPETAQGSYVNFKNVLQSSRKKLPFGIAQVGKSFRNEISPGNFVFRMREFEQVEMQYFVRPEAEAAAAFETYASATRTVRAARGRSGAPAAPRARATSSRTTRRRRSTSNTASRSGGRSSRASTTARISTSRAIPRRAARNSSTSTRRQAST